MLSGRGVSVRRDLIDLFAPDQVRVRGDIAAIVLAPPHEDAEPSAQ